MSAVVAASDEPADRQAASGDGQEPPKKPAIKRRTKTGCRTCRQRRIKCDEGKPLCNNCIKSKRPCEGYFQRVVFKDPLGTFQNALDPASFHDARAPPPPPLLVSHPAVRNLVPASQDVLPFIAPRPQMMGDHRMGLPHQYAPPLPPHMQSHMPQQNPHPMPQHPSQHLPQHFPQHTLSLLPEQVISLDSSVIDPRAAPFLPGNPTEAPLDTGAFAPTWPQQQQQQQPPAPPIDHAPSYVESASLGNGHVSARFLQPVGFDSRLSDFSTEWIPTDTLVSDRDDASAIPLQPSVPQQPEPMMHQTNTRHKRFEVYEEDGYWYSDDDASMAESDDYVMPAVEAKHLASNDLGLIVANRLDNRPVDLFGTQMRTFQNFADANVLATYFPSSSNSPLNDAQTAAVFWYFVNVTGPSMSLFERRPVDPSSMFQGLPIPRAHQHIWTYTFPTISLNHPALLQAILALGSLQMAKLQGVPATASMKHYHLSLRRVARNYQSPSRRLQPATLAATLLLGFYEVWNSDHEKWCKHMWGASAILKEIPLSDMTRKVISVKREHRKRLEDMHNNGRIDINIDEAIVSMRDIDQVDAGLVAQIAGQPAVYHEASGSLENFLKTTERARSWTVPEHYTEKDIETYETISDLFWWYCKMDVYQSILGGTPLLMDYGHWTKVAPRAPFGKIDTTYGTYDHLYLLLGRLCNFAAKDRPRKRKASRSDVPAGAQGQSPPGFVGMMPTTGRVPIPKGFSPPRETTPQSDNREDIDFDESTAQALREWEAIRQTMEEFRTLLGPDFEPLGPEYEMPAACPFGTVLKYRTYNVAGIWMSYYMGLIVLYRSHPSMPQVAMTAAGLVAKQTAPYANEIGRIICGLTTEDLSNASYISTLVGCIAIEAALPLFVGAIQFQDTEQRHWTIRCLRNVSRLTGWQSARKMTSGCEICWSKAASIGRGPAYQRASDLEEVEGPVSRLLMANQRKRELAEVEGHLQLSKAERPHYAIGLLSMEEDMERLDLHGDGEKK